ncbi:hypothetical protein [Shimazuella kribbensis]|uniref:hypothetical protein n=1 Tax=Shimazuella kribbensis TaxID=139808 RepID=UPI000414068C|nr:hypothetical protein [Shimazuella kribbensis]
MKQIILVICILFPILAACTLNSEHEQKEKLLIGTWKETENGCRLYNQLVFQENGDLKAMVGRHQWLDGYYEHLKGDLYDLVVPDPRHHEITLKIQGNQMTMSAAYVDYTCTMIKQETEK